MPLKVARGLNLYNLYSWMHGVQYPVHSLGLKIELLFKLQVRKWNLCFLVV